MKIFKHVLVALTICLSQIQVASAGLSGSYGCLFNKNYAGRLVSETGDTNAWAGGVMELNLDARTWVMHQILIDGFETTSAKSSAIDLTGTVSLSAAEHENEYSAESTFAWNGSSLTVNWQIVSVGDGSSLIGMFPYKPSDGEVSGVTATLSCTRI